MLVILDECVPRPLRRHLAGHDVATAQERGWAGVKNGALLRAMREAQVDVFVTTDRNLQYQQNLATSGLAIVVLVAFTNTLEDLIPFVSDLLVAIERTQPGRIAHVGA